MKKHRFIAMLLCVFMIAPTFPQVWAADDISEKTSSEMSPYEEKVIFIPETGDEYALWKEQYDSNPTDETNSLFFNNSAVSNSMMLSAVYVNNNYIRNEYIEAYIGSK